MDTQINVKTYQCLQCLLYGKIELIALLRTLVKYCIYLVSVLNSNKASYPEQLY